ncbi:FAD:protein FMN transferase [Lentilactobacillus farraginis]|uniref:FAD:protein FMN transferase n=1 Tax=Lentilactobacillus farraginis DSM 18382 = JCM 14108 TaxID=1423743 RepID=X0PA00_9LACO|nr:FAD:protein FMN transferase [Lentilactobacillus farraginis]KRM11518.1 thiamin biosynthesis lipoprotein ApbE [Lentilactobacillus farraginis DSM 18382 = JCM 14108]GAF36129.1 thiamin biosynthesis lipoprotein ApbE [Lentilactobacillus farraginis DSM 18382 = JCM 14108]
MIEKNLARQKTTKTYYGLGTKINLTLFGNVTDSQLNASNQLIAYYEDLLTVNRPHSEVMAINQAAGKQPVQVSDATYTLTKRALQLSRQRFGFNATIGPLVKLWRIGFAGAQVPTQTAINERLKIIDPDQTNFDDQNLTIFLKQPGMELDLGGIAKGYIADRVADYWRAYGRRSGMIDLGGNLLLVGDAPTHTDGLWRIGVQEPNSKRGQSILNVAIGPCSAVTSGIYERHLEAAGHSYHHILDSQTGYPKENDLASVTIFSKKSIDGEIETARLFFAGQPIPGWAVDRPDIYGAVFVTKDKRVTIVGLENATVTLLDDTYQVKSVVKK